MKLSFCGSQSGMVDFQKEEFARLLKELDCSELIHGDNYGSDKDANEIALKEGVKVFHLFPSTLHPKRAWSFLDSPDDRQVALLGYQLFQHKGNIVTIEKPEKPLERNKKIVDASDILIATPKEHTHTLRSGTWATIRYAWKKKKRVIVIPPIVREENDNQS